MYSVHCGYEGSTCFVKKKIYTSQKENERNETEFKENF